MQSLTASEVQIMKCIWDANERLALSEILKRVNTRYNKGWKPQTASTFVSRLVQKGFLRLDRSVRYYSYEVLITEDEYLNQEISKFTEFWGDGIGSKVVKSLVESNKLGNEEANEIRNMMNGI